MQPLQGILVLDFSTLLPGPLATLMLAEAGAEVIKIERPGGEEMRQFPPMWEGESATFAMLNRGNLLIVAKSHKIRDQGHVIVWVNAPLPEQVTDVCRDRGEHREIIRLHWPSIDIR